jgi:hypothetical protein
MHYGQLLADYNTVAQVPATLRLIVHALILSYAKPLPSWHL